VTHRAHFPTRLLLLAALLFVPFVAQALNPNTALRQYGRQTWQSDTGLPQNTVHAILQTHDGFLWLATEGGLVRFDGQDFLTYTTPQLPTNTINHLIEDDQNTLWISTPDGLVSLSLSYENHQNFKLYTTSSGLPSNNIRAAYPRASGLLVLTSAGAAILHQNRFEPIPNLPADLTPANISESPDHTLWIATPHQLFSLPATAPTPQLAPIPAELTSLQTLAAAPDGTLWIASHDTIAHLIPNHAPLLLHPSSPITALHPEPNGTLWIGTTTGLLLYTHGTLKPIPTSSPHILQLFEDRSHALWVTTDRTITRITSPHQGSQPSTEDLPIPGILTLFEDREGDLWIGTDTNGLTILRDQPISTLTTADGLSDDFVRALFEDHAHTLWIGTNRGGLDSLRDGVITPLDAQLQGPQRLSSSVVLALTETRGLDPTDSGTLWIGTPDGLARLEDHRLTLFTTADGLPDDFIRSLYTDTDNSLWIGTRNGLAHYVASSPPAVKNGRTGTFTSYSSLDGLGSDVIGAILRAHDGTLWVGTLNGLSRLNPKGDSFTTSTTKNGLAGNAITALYEDATGTLWIAAHSAGLTRLRNGVFAPIQSSTLPEEISSILESWSSEPLSPSAQPSAEKTLFLGSNHGIYRVSLAALNAFADKPTPTLPPTVFTTADGMAISECSSGGHPAAWRMHDGTLRFATLKGIASLDPTSTLDILIPPLTALEQVLADDQPITPNKSTLTVPEDTERLTLHYAGLSFAAPQKIHFRYKLEGFDRDWIDAGPRRTAFYTNLPPGTYRFLVSVSTNTAQWSTPTQLRLHLKPRFTQTPWFFVLLLALILATLALIAWLIYRARVRIVEARYRAVLEERTRIAREIHDTLAQGYVGVSVQLELTSRLLKSSPEAAANQLELTKDLVRASLDDARSSIWNLRTTNPAQPETLPHRIVSTIQSRRTQGNIDPTIRLDVHGTYRPLSPRIEDELLRIAQESLANALNHAQASHITVILAYDAHHLQLRITDDGIGFTLPPNGFAPTGHFGLKGLEERAHAIQAKLHIDTRLGHGTTVELLLHLAAEKYTSTAGI
jgi:ligand-binding sensor domain-containing protein/signal transduction histidine kinase